MKNGDSIVGKIIVLLFYLLLFCFFYFFPLLTEVFAEGVEEVDVEVVEVVETIEHVVTIQQEDPEPVDLGHPTRHFMGVPSIVSDRIVDEFSLYAPFWFDSVSSGELDYFFYYDEGLNQYWFLVLDRHYFVDGETFFFFSRDSSNVGIFGLDQDNISLQFPFVIVFDGDTGDFVDMFEPIVWSDWPPNNLTWIPNGFLVGTSLFFGLHPVIENVLPSIPPVGQSGYNWFPVLQRSIVLREGVRLYETHAIALLLFIGFSFVFVSYFGYGYFTRKY